MFLMYVAYVVLSNNRVGELLNPESKFGAHKREHIKVEDSPLDLLRWQLLLIWSQRRSA